MVEILRTRSEEISLEATLGLILKNSVNALAGEAGVVATWSESEHRFVASASYGLDVKTLSQIQPILNEVAPDLAGSKDSFDLLSELLPSSALPLSDKGVRQNSIIALPLQIGGEWTGLIYVLRPLNAASFSKADQPILTAFAEQAAIAVQNARLAHFLAEEKRRVESILESSADGIMSIDSKHQLIGFNLAMEKLTSYAREEVLGRECFRVLDLRDRENRSLCNTQCPMIDSSNMNSTFEQQGMIRAKDGRSVDVAMTYSIARSPDGKPVNAVVNVRDISKSLELENLRETFLSMLGHELQTPLSIIKGYASTLASSDGKWNQEALRRGLNVIEEESDRLNKIVTKLLLASRISAGALVLEKEPVDMASLVGKVVRRFQAVTRIHAFEIDFGPDFPTVSAEPALMEEVMTNLVDNAIKYSPQGGTVDITGIRSDKQVKITVADQGIGILPDEREHIFERFYRADSRAARKLQGTGLGLYICKSIIEAHGGKIKVASHVEKGSQFTFTLPLEK